MQLDNDALQRDALQRDALQRDALQRGSIVIPWVLDPRNDDLDLEVHGCGCGCGCDCGCDSCDACESCGCDDAEDTQDEGLNDAIAETIADNQAAADTAENHIDTEDGKRGDAMALSEATATCEAQVYGTASGTVLGGFFSGAPPEVTIIQAILDGKDRRDESEECKTMDELREELNAN